MALSHTACYNTTQLMGAPQEQEKISNQLPFSENAKEVLERAKRATRRSNHHYLKTRHLLLGLMEEPRMTRLFSMLFQNKIHSAAAEFILIEEESDISIEEVRFTPSAIEVIKLADREAKDYYQLEITPIDLLTGLVHVEGVAAEILKSAGLNKDNLSDLRNWYMLLK